VFNSTTGTAVNQTFRLQSEAVGNNTSAASGTLNLLYATGANAAVETGLNFASNGQIGFATGQTFPGTISGVTAGPGLTGGGTSGNVPLSLLTTCASGQVLQWNGATWVCTTPKHGTVNSVSLNAPSSDFTVSGSPITGSGTLGLAWKVAPTSGNTGVAGRGSDYGVTGIGRIGVFGSGYASSNTIGVGGVGNVGVSAQGDVYGVHAFNSPLSAGVGVWGESDKSDGLHGVSHGSQAAGVAALNDQGGDAILAVVTNGGLAGSFFGDVDVEGNVSKSGGSFKIDHPLDPAGKYLYHSFVESPDMKNIYDGNVITDAQGDAIVTMPDWFEALNRDFRYQLTVIGTFAQAIVATEIANGSFSIKTDKPNVKVSWQVTGVRQDAWANAHRIPIEEAKPDRERGFYLHPELFGAPEEKGIVWARHPEMMKRAHEKGPQLPLLTKH
jgi:hypothetical protein